MKKDINETNEIILKLYNQGFSCKDISLSCNIPLLSIRHCLQDAGFNTRAYRKISNSNKEKVVLLVKAGYSYKRIEQLLYVSSHAIREIISDNGMIGFSPRYHHPVQLDVEEEKLSKDRLSCLQQSYLSGAKGLALCATDSAVSDEEFLWFVYHLTEKDQIIHNKQLLQNLLRMHKEGFPVAAIAKAMDISLSLVKKAIRRAV